MLGLRLVRRSSSPVFSQSYIAGDFGFSPRLIQRVQKGGVWGILANEQVNRGCSSFLRKWPMVFAFWEEYIHICTYILLRFSLIKKHNMTANKTQLILHKKSRSWNKQSLMLLQLCRWHVSILSFSVVTGSFWAKQNNKLLISEVRGSVEYFKLGNPALGSHSVSLGAANLVKKKKQITLKGPALSQSHNVCMP